MDGAGPRESVVRALTKPGNAYFEPVFYVLAEDDVSPARNDERCYYFPVQVGSRLEAARVSHVARLCYRSPFKTPWRSTSLSVLR